MKYITNKLRRLIFIMLTISATYFPFMADAGTFTLDECQQMARDNYPLIKQYDLIRQTTDYNVSNIAKGWLPHISAVAQATYQSDVMTLPEPLQNVLGQFGYSSDGLRKDQYCIGIDISQTIYDGGRIGGRQKVARLEGEVQEAQTETDLYAVRSRINDLYFGILLLDEEIRLNNDLQTLLQSNLDKLQSMLAHGVAMQSDVDMVKAEKLQAGQQAAELAASRKSLMDMLSVFIGKEVTGVTMPGEAAVDPGVNNRPELSLFDKQLQLADAQENLLKAGLLPRLSLFAQGFYGYPGYDQFESMFKHDWTLNGIVGVKLSWNIGSLYTNSNDRAKLAARRDMVNTSRETFLFNNRLLEIQQTDGIGKYRKLLVADREIVELRGNVRRAAESKLEHGIIDTNNLLQEITRENQSKIDLSTHLIQMLKENYDLKYTLNR